MSNISSEGGAPSTSALAAALDDVESKMEVEYRIDKLMMAHKFFFSLLGQNVSLKKRTLGTLYAVNETEEI